VLRFRPVALFHLHLGDYQFDIYRLMRKHNGGRWADFRPLSNVMVCPLLSYVTTNTQCESNQLIVVTLPTHQIAQVQELTPTEKGCYCGRESRFHGTTVL
jgi:Haspin like kinase domain